MKKQVSKLNLNKVTVNELSAPAADVKGGITPTLTITISIVALSFGLCDIISEGLSCARC